MSTSYVSYRHWEQWVRSTMLSTCIACSSAFQTNCHTDQMKSLWGHMTRKKYHDQVHYVVTRNGYDSDVTEKYTCVSNVLKTVTV